MNTTRMTVTAVALICCAGLLTSGTSAQSADKAEEFSAIFANISNVGAVGATPLTIRINRWTDNDENEKLMSTLRDKGTEALVRELQDTRAVGSIGTPQELPYDLRYARQLRTEDGGRRIILMTDRPMAFAERMSASVSRDYPLTWIELKLDAEGRGEGTVAVAARLRLVGDVLGIENLANQPARLNQVRKVK
jgi:hypothetical protein